MAHEDGPRQDPGQRDADVLVRIRGLLPSLQPAQRRVAASVLDAPSEVAQLPITSLAARAATSTATVLRLCRSAGIANYPRLRLALASAVARDDARAPDGAAVGDLDANDSLDDIVAKIVYQETRALEDTAGQLDRRALHAAVEAIERAERVDVFGVAASGLVAQDLAQKLHRIGRIAYVWTDVHAALTAAALLGPSGVAVGISHSGATPDTVEPLRLAAERGATTVALTNFAGSPLARTAELVLRTAVRETPLRSGATASRIAQLAVVDCLFVGVAQRSYAASTAALATTWRAVHTRRPDRYA